MVNGVKKVCYLGNYKEISGYSNAARENILALHSAGVIVVPRYVKMTDNRHQINSTIEQLEKQGLDSVDAIIQHNLPSEFAYTDKVINIGCYAWETSGFPNSTWGQHIKMMDKMIVPSSFMKSITPNINTHIVPHGLDTEKFTATKHCEFGANKDTLKFYTIGESNKRKNLNGLIAAYSMSFDALDNVVLIIKTNCSPNALKENIDDIRRGLKRFANPHRYPKIIVIHNFLSDQQIDEIHNNSDVYVSMSYGEGFCIPAAEAMGWGNMLLVPDSSAFKDFNKAELHNEFVKTSPSKCFGSVDSLPDVYTSDETWWTPDIYDMSTKMKIIYDTRVDKQYRGLRKEYVKNTYSRKVVGQQLKDIL